MLEEQSRAVCATARAGRGGGGGGAAAGAGGARGTVVGSANDDDSATDEDLSDTEMEARQINAKEKGEVWVAVRTKRGIKKAKKEARLKGKHGAK